MLNFGAHTCPLAQVTALQAPKSTHLRVLLQLLGICMELPQWAARLTLKTGTEGGRCRPTHTARQVRRAPARAFMAPDCDVTWAEAPSVSCCVQLTHIIARRDRYEKKIRSAWCPSAPWYGAATIASNPICRLHLFPELYVSRTNKMIPSSFLLQGV